MPIIPVRDLSQGGILKDVHPTTYPVPAWSNGRNVCFQDGKAYRSPIWRKVVDSVGSDLRFCTALTPDTGFDKLILVRDNSRVYSYVGGTLTEISEAGFVASTDATSPWTACFLGNVLYLNRRDRVPRAWKPGATNLVALANWDSTWRCRALRNFGDSLIALNVTKGITDNRSMVKVSDITLYGDVPASWDSSDPSTLAYENPLAQLDGPILDGRTLGDRFLFYTAGQCWEMRQGGPQDYTFRKINADDGIIATNCVIEVNGLHFVFGSKDVYMTDGVSRKSIGEGTVRQWLFRTMNTKLAYRNFVAHSPWTNEIIFAYVSGSPDASWKTPTGCNFALTYNLANGRTSFIDLPNVSAMTLCNLDSVMTYNTTGTRTMDGVGGSYFDQEDSYERHVAAVAAPLSTPGSITTITGGGKVLGYDFVDRGQLGFEADAECAAPSFVERTGIALDSQQELMAPLTTAKEVRAMFPEVNVSRDLPITVTMGGQMATSGPITWEAPVTFNPITDYKVDTRAEGRFLAVRFDFEAGADTEISGFDLDVIPNGSR